MIDLLGPIALLLTAGVILKQARMFETLITLLKEQHGDTYEALGSPVGMLTRLRTQGGRGISLQQSVAGRALWMFIRDGDYAQLDDPVLAALCGRLLVLSRFAKVGVFAVLVFVFLSFML